MANQVRKAPMPPNQTSIAHEMAQGMKEALISVGLKDRRYQEKEPWEYPKGAPTGLAMDRVIRVRVTHPAGAYRNGSRLLRDDQFNIPLREFSKTWMEFVSVFDDGAVEESEVPVKS